MKKLLSLVLICAMGFGMISCVESEESPSVTAIRNAKSEQLKALTGLYNAQAEAAKITAQAEAALKAAEAAYKEALTAQTEQEIENAKALLAAEIEKIKAEAEKALWEAKKEAAEYEQYIFENANQRIQDLYLAYANAMNELSSTKNQLMNAKSNMTALEAGVIDAKDNAAYYIGEQNRLIAGYEAQLEVLKDPKYTSANRDSLWAMQGALYKEYQLAYNYYQTSDVKKAADDAYTAAVEAFENMNDELSEMNQVQYNGGRLIHWQFDYNNENLWFSENGVQTPLATFYVNETNLEAWKNYIVNSNLEDAVATATENLAKAEATLEAFKGFKADFDKAVEARAALVAYDKAYANYDAVSETVEYAEELAERYAGYVKDQQEIVDKYSAQLKALKKVDLSAFSSEDYGELKDGWWYNSDLSISMNAFRDNLLNLEAAKTTLKAAQDAQKALASTATDAEKEAAQDAVDNAAEAVGEYTAAVKAAYDKAVYDLEVIVENETKYLASRVKSKENYEKKIVTAKENKAALIAAYAPARAAMATLDGLFKSGSDFRKFWSENGFWCDVETDGGTYSVYSPSFKDKYNFISDYNNDNIPDVKVNADGTVVDGLFDANTQDYYYFYDLAPSATYTNSSTGNTYKYYYYNGGDYAVVTYDQIYNHYAAEVAKAKDALTIANYNLSQANEWNTNWDAKEAELREFVAGLNEQIPAIQALVDAYYEAEEAREAAEEEIEILYNKYSAAYDLYRYGVDIDQQIRSLEDDIAGCKMTIANYEKSITDAEAQLEYGKEHIANLEAQIEYLQQLVDSAKAALDAAISAQNAE